MVHCSHNIVGAFFLHLPFDCLSGRSARPMACPPAHRWAAAAAPAPPPPSEVAVVATRVLCAVRVVPAAGPRPAVVLDQVLRLGPAHLRPHRHRFAATGSVALARTALVVLALALAARLRALVREVAHAPLDVPAAAAASHRPAIFGNTPHFRTTSPLPRLHTAHELVHVLVADALLAALDEDLALLPQQRGRDLLHAALGLGQRRLLRPGPPPQRAQLALQRALAHQPLGPLAPGHRQLPLRPLAPLLELVHVLLRLCLEFFQGGFFLYLQLFNLLPPIPHG
mmetsp:Transcript_33672/g.61236  ORF Transcript_33672/g.61236 Transcript_33672/m.61236 type:complete len:283 (-) Transcript_33672:317-1165(-)